MPILVVVGSPFNETAARSIRQMRQIRQPRDANAGFDKLFFELQLRPIKFRQVVAASFYPIRSSMRPFSIRPMRARAKRELYREQALRIHPQRKQAIDDVISKLGRDWHGICIHGTSSIVLLRTIRTPCDAIGRAAF